MYFYKYIDLINERYFFKDQETRIKIIQKIKNNLCLITFENFQDFLQFPSLNPFFFQNFAQ